MTNTPDLRALVEQIRSGLLQQAQDDCSTAPPPDTHVCLVAIAVIESLQHRVAEMEEALESAGQVIDYTAATFWTGRPGAIAIRPAQVDKALRSFRKARSTLKDRGEGR